MHSVKSRQQLADEYGIHRITLNRWLKKANIDLPGGLISPLMLQVIYAQFGLPKPQRSRIH
jgi:hypothetical protein